VQKCNVMFSEVLLGVSWTVVGVRSNSDFLILSRTVLEEFAI
jgi:hypothetical protein